MHVVQNLHLLCLAWIQPTVNFHTADGQYIEDVFLMFDWVHISSIQKLNQEFDFYALDQKNTALYLQIYTSSNCFKDVCTSF